MAESLQKTIGKGVLWDSSGNILIKIAGLASIFLILQRFSAYEYGLLELALAVVAMLSIFLLPGLNDMIIADMGILRGKNDIAGMKHIFWNFFKLQIACALLAWAIVFFGAHILSEFSGSNIVLYLRIASFTFLLSPFRTLFTTLFVVNFKFGIQSLFSLLEEMFKFLFLLLMFFVINTNAEGVILAGVFAQVVLCLVMLPVFMRLYRPMRTAIYTEEHTGDFWALLYAHGKWTLFSRYLDTFGKNARLWIIRFMLGTEAVGLFAVADGLFNHTTSFIPISKIITPIIPQYVEKRDQFLKLVNKSIKYQLIGYTFLGLFAFFVFPPIIVYLFPHYASSMSLFRLLLAILIPVSFAPVFTAMFFAFKAQANLFYSICIKTASVFILTPVCIYFFGEYGIAYSYFLVTLIFVLERYRILKQLIPGFRLNVRDFVTADSYDRMLVGKIITTFRTKLHI